MNPMDAFNTVAVANKGRKLPLLLPDGSPSEHYLIVGHVYADAFRAKSEQIEREFAEAKFGDDAMAAKKFMDDNRPVLLASLIYGWSFEKECTPENVAAFLKTAPQIMAKVDEYAGSTAFFFGNEPVS